MTDEPVRISQFGHCYMVGDKVTHTDDCQCDRDYQEDLDNELSFADNEQ